MEMAVIAIVALLAGAGLGWFLGSRPVAEWKARHGERDAEARETEEKFRKAIVDLENATVRAGRADALDAELRDTRRNHEAALDNLRRSNGELGAELGAEAREDGVVGENFVALGRGLGNRVHVAGAAAARRRRARR